MTTLFFVEPGVEAVTGHCDHCGHESRIFRGFVNTREGAYAVYIGAYTQAHPEFGVSLAVSLRGWGDGADPSIKECVVLDWRNTNSGPACMVAEASASTWAGEHILGRMLSRDEALTCGRAQEAFAVSDAVWQSDVRLSQALAGG
jgi:hypothetical protein